MTIRYGLLRHGDVFITPEFEHRLIRDTEGYGFQVDTLHGAMHRKTYPFNPISYNKTLSMFWNNPDMRVYQARGAQQGFWKR